MRRAIEPPLARWEQKSSRPARLAARLRAYAREGRPIPETLDALAPLMRGMTQAQICQAVAIAREAAALPDLSSARRRHRANADSGGPAT